MRTILAESLYHNKYNNKNDRQNRLSPTANNHLLLAGQHNTTEN